MIPARIGSQRLKFKNLCLINGKPLIYYSINSSRKSKVFDKIIINSDHKIFSKIADRYKVEFFKRPSILGGNNIKSDDVVNNFFKNFDCDILVWVNPIAPLQEAKEIKKIVNYFKNNKFDSLYTVVNRKVHSLFKNRILNFNKNTKFQQTQSLTPVTEMVYSLMMWRKKSFTKFYGKYKNAFLRGKVCYYPVDQENLIIVKNINDIKIAESFILTKQKNELIKYDKLLKKIND